MGRVGVGRVVAAGVPQQQCVGRVVDPEHLGVEGALAAFQAGDGGLAGADQFGKLCLGQPLLNTQTGDLVTWFQIAGGGVPGVCGTPSSASVIAFPPRDQTYGFRLQLEDFYRVDLARAAVKTSVDAEGDVVWIQEYLRYRLNGCTHAQSLDKVTDQIEGRGVPPVCK